MFSVICCYNNKRMYDINIKNKMYKVIREFDPDCELIGIDNSNNRFDSAAMALNWGCERAKQGVIIITHQDILVDDSFVNKLKACLIRLNNNAILGAGGINKEGIYTNILHSEKKVYAGPYRVDKPIPVDTLDECFFLFSKSCWESYPFNENICDGWHLYAAEMCLNARKNGNEVYVVDLPLYHYSPGRVDTAYLTTFYKLCKEYENDFRTIRTMNFTCGTRFPFAKLCYKWVRIIFRKILKGR